MKMQCMKKQLLNSVFVMWDLSRSRVSVLLKRAISNCLLLERFNDGCPRGGGDNFIIFNKNSCSL